MKKVVYDISIRVISGFHISTGSDEGGYLDKYTLKDTNNSPYIPGSTIKGKVRDNFIMIGEFIHRGENCGCPACRIFGTKGYFPSNVYFEDLRSNERIKPSIRFGNAIDRFRKSAKDHALYSQEVGNSGQYRGRIVLYVDEEAEKYIENFEMAVKMIDSIGGGKSRGLGQVEVNLKEVKE